MAGKLAYAEYFDGAGAIMSWAGGAPMNWRCLVEDFPTKFAIQYSCNGDSTWSMNSGGIADFNGPIAVTFVDNPDTDTSAGEQTIQAKLLGYVELLTKPGYPFVYGKDYFPSSVWPGAYGLKPWIDTLVGIHENLMFGDPQVLYLDGSVRVKMSHGYPGLLTGMNFDTYNNRTVTVWTTFGAGVQLHDYSGHHPDIWTDGEGRATFEIPCNAYNGGQGYVCFSRGGYWEVGEIPQRPTTQVFYGADDLDIPGIGLGSTQVGRIYVAAGSDISARLKVTGRSKTLTITADIVGPRPPDGPTPFSSVVPAGRTVMFFGSGKATETGWHDLQIECLTTGPTVPFELEVTYTAPQTLELNGTTAPWSVEIPQKPGQEPNDVTPT
jgi:alpha-amylase